MDREAAIELGAEVVESLADSLLSCGQNPNIERNELISVGIVQAIRTVDRNLGSGSRFPLNKAIARDAKTIMLRFIAKERRDARYRRGRDTDGSLIPRRMPASIWMGRDRLLGWYFPELEPKFEYPADAADFCMRPVLECIVSTPHARPEPRDTWGYPIDPAAELGRLRAGAEVVRRMREMESEPFIAPRRKPPVFRFCLFGPANFSAVHSMVPAL